MSESEHRYYEDQKGPRLMECDKGVDPVWYAAMMKKQRAKEIEEQYREVCLPSRTWTPSATCSTKREWW